MDDDAAADQDAQGERAPDAEISRDPDGDVPAVSDPDASFAVLGGPDDGPTLDLDHERFAYAGKFVTSGTGKAVVRASGPGTATGAGGGGGEVLAAAAFDRDRTDRSVVKIRYVTVRADLRGEGLGARLLASLAGYALDDGSPLDGVREVEIAVNNPYAYEAAYKAGFGFTGERTGLAELVCARPGDRSAETYRRGLSAFVERGDQDGDARSFAEERRRTGPPDVAAPLPGP